MTVAVHIGGLDEHRTIRQISNRMASPFVKRRALWANARAGYLTTHQQKAE
jgi:hypothetical protein